MDKHKSFRACENSTTVRAKATMLCYETMTKTHDAFGQAVRFFHVCDWLAEAYALSGRSM